MALFMWLGIIIKKAVETLKKSESAGGNLDQCLYAKKCERGVVFVALYADDNLMVGESKAIDDILTALKEKGLVL